MFWQTEKCFEKLILGRKKIQNSVTFTCRATTNYKAMQMFRSSSDFYKYPSKCWTNDECEKDVHWHEPPTHMKPEVRHQKNQREITEIEFRKWGENWEESSRVEIYSQRKYTARCNRIGQIASNKCRGEHIEHQLFTVHKVSYACFQKQVSDTYLFCKTDSVNCNVVWLTLFKWCLATGPKRFTRSIASNNPMAVIINVFRTGINAATNRSRNSIMNLFYRPPRSLFSTPDEGTC